MQFGGLHFQAKELRVPTWVDADGYAMDAPLTLADLGTGYKIIYNFQHWCPGCHSRGFPTLRYLQDNLKDKEFEFAVIQTVFEGSKVNTFDKLRVNQQQYGLKMPFGHDVAPEGERNPSFMEDYRTAGTPWFTVIAPDGEVIYADFRIDPDRFLKTLGADDVRFEAA